MFQYNDSVESTQFEYSVSWETIFWLKYRLVYYESKNQLSAVWEAELWPGNTSG